MHIVSIASVYVVSIASAYIVSIASAYIVSIVSVPVWSCSLMKHRLRSQRLPAAQPLAPLGEPPADLITHIITKLISHTSLIHA